MAIANKAQIESLTALHRKGIERLQAQIQQNSSVLKSKEEELKKLKSKRQEIVDALKQLKDPLKAGTFDFKNSDKDDTFTFGSLPFLSLK